MVVPVLLRMPRERVSPRLGETDEVDDPECESPNKEAELGPRRDNVDATISVPVPDITSSNGSAVAVAVAVEVKVTVVDKPFVNEELEYQLEVALRVSVPLAAVKKGSSLELVLVVSDGRVLELPLGGGVKDTARPLCAPLEIVTGEPSPTGSEARLKPKPRPPLEFRAILSAVLNPSSRSVMELVRLSELIRLGGITRGSA